MSTLHDRNADLTNVSSIVYGNNICLMIIIIMSDQQI